MKYERIVWEPANYCQSNPHAMHRMETIRHPVRTAKPSIKTAKRFLIGRLAFTNFKHELGLICEYSEKAELSR